MSGVAFNICPHSSIGYSPFQVVYGRPPQFIPQYILGTSSNETVESTMISRDKLANLIINLLKAMEIMKAKEDKHRMDLIF